MGWLDGLRRKNRHDRFIQLLIDQAEYTVRGADALLDYLHAPSKDKAAAANQLEKEADEVRHILIDELNRTFVTPSTASTPTPCRAPSTTSWTTPTPQSISSSSSKSNPTTTSSGWSP